MELSKLARKQGAAVTTPRVVFAPVSAGSSEASTAAAALAQANGEIVRGMLAARAGAGDAAGVGSPLRGESDAWARQQGGSPQQKQHQGRAVGGPFAAGSGGRGSGIEEWSGLPTPPRAVPQKLFQG